MTSEEAPSTEQEASVEHRAPEEAFGLLGNETRVEILFALGQSPEEPVTFSELRERVGARDSGQFNYHLGKLTDNFVRKTDDGYELTLAGTSIVGALRAGTYTADVSIDPIELDDPCPRCEGTLVAAYEDEHVSVSCQNCEDWGNQFTFPPGTIEQFDRGELPAAFDRWLKTRVAEIVAGFCPNCYGRLDGSLESDEGHANDVAATFMCERCGEIANVSPRALLFTDPVANAFYHDHGLAFPDTPTWEIDRRSDSALEFRGPDRDSIELTITVGDERLVARIDSSASVESVEREPA